MIWTIILLVKWWLAVGAIGTATATYRMEWIEPVRLTVEESVNSPWQVFLALYLGTLMEIPKAPVHVLSGIFRRRG